MILMIVIMDVRGGGATAVASGGCRGTGPGREPGGELGKEQMGSALA